MKGYIFTLDFSYIWDYLSETPTPNEVGRGFSEYISIFCKDFSKDSKKYYLDFLYDIGVLFYYIQDNIHFNELITELNKWADLDIDDLKLCKIVYI